MWKTRESGAEIEPSRATVDGMVRLARMAQTAVSYCPVMRTIANHTESETVVQYALTALGVVGIILALGLHHSWAWALVAVAVIPSTLISIRAMKRRPGRF